MKKHFMKFLPIAAAILLATSCSKDSDGDNNIVANPDATESAQEVVDNQVKTVPFAITVCQDAPSLSKATVEDDGTNLVQKFESDDVLVITGDGIIGSVELTLTAGAGTTSATFEGEIPTTVASGTSLTATLTNSTHPNAGNVLAVQEIHQVASLAKGFEEYGCLIKTFEYNGASTATIMLEQKNAFLEIIVNPTVTSVTVNDVVYSPTNGLLYLAVGDGTTIESNLLSGSKKVQITENDGKLIVVKRINRAHAFSVADGKKVYFSKGNLQYDIANDKFQFASSQSDIIGNADANNTFSPPSGVIDLFGWGTWLDGMNPTERTDDNSAYNADFSNGNKTTVDGVEWRTLTADEWSYLFEYAQSQYMEVDGKKGVVLMPDDWTDTFDGKSWNDLENAGAVFLPVAGTRTAASVIMTNGYYWTATADVNNTAKYVFVYENDYPTKGVAYSSTDRKFGYAVRLVRDL